MANNWRLFVCGGLLSSLLLTNSCANKTSNNEAVQQSKNKTYKGELYVGCDAGLEPVIKQEIEVFSYSNDSVAITPVYEGEEALFNDFRSGRVSVMILPRQLEQAEKDRFKDRDTIYTREIVIAYDAVALIGSKKFDDRQLDEGTLRRYLTGTAGGTSPKLVFDSKNAGMVKEVLKALGYTGEKAVNVYALDSTEQVISYVEDETNAIGFVPFAFVSDTDDDRVKKILHRVKILSLRAKDQEGKPVAVSANQSDIAEGTYPLKRTITAVTRFRYEDNLEWLFVNFMYKERGAKIFLKAGLIPAKMPVREINVNTGPIKGGS